MFLPTKLDQAVTWVKDDCQFVSTSVGTPTIG